MPDPIVIFNAAIGAANFALKLIEIFSGKPNRRKQDAARAIVLALAATEDYLETHDPTAEADRAQEKRLRELWNEASRAIFPLDREVSILLSVKSDYWRNPDRWTKKQIKEAGIRLRDVRIAASKFI